MTGKFTIAVLNMRGDELDRQSDIIEIFNAGRAALIARHQALRVLAAGQDQRLAYYDDIIEGLRALILTSVVETV